LLTIPFYKHFCFQLFLCKNTHAFLLEFITSACDWVFTFWSPPTILSCEHPKVRVFVSFLNPLIQQHAIYRFSIYGFNKYLHLILHKWKQRHLVARISHILHELLWPSLSNFTA
jgi:hypothetical protein